MSSSKQPWRNRFHINVGVDMQRQTFWHRVHSYLGAAASSRSERPAACQVHRKNGVHQRHHTDAVAPRILLLTSALGSGHVRAAQAIQIALLQRAPAATIRVIDWWSLMNPDVARTVRETYLQLVQEHSQLYEDIYRLDQSTWSDSLSNQEPLPASVVQLFELLRTLHTGTSFADTVRGPYASDRALVTLFCATAGDGKRVVAGGVHAKLALMKWSWARLTHRLERKIAEFNPDVIVSTQMIPAALVSSIKLNRRATIPSIAVPTDFGVHDFWNQPGTDLYCLGHEDVSELPEGFNARRVVITGFPLMPEFTNRIDGAAARRVLGLLQTVPVVLILGGGLGLGVDVVAEHLLQMHTPMQLLIASGHNPNIGAKLAMLQAQVPSRMRIFDWTDRMDIVISAADLVVGKPGGLTVAEVLACGRPLLATRSLRGQEGFNVRFIERHQAGLLLSDIELVEQVEFLLTHPAELAACKAQAWRVGRRHGAARIAAQVLAQVSQKSQGATEHKPWQLDYEH